MPSQRGDVTRLSRATTTQQQRIRYRHQLYAMVRVYNEAAWLREWLEFHRMQGVERFLVYDDQSTDDLGAVLAPYVATGLVEVIRWNHNVTGGGLGGSLTAGVVAMVAPIDHAIN